MQARATSKIAVAGASADRVALSRHFRACGIWLTRPKVLHQTRSTGRFSFPSCLAWSLLSENLGISEAVRNVQDVALVVTCLFSTSFLATVHCCKQETARARRK